MLQDLFGEGSTLKFRNQKYFFNKFVLIEARYCSQLLTRQGSPGCCQREAHKP